MIRRSLLTAAASLVTLSTLVTLGVLHAMAGNPAVEVGIA